MHRVCARVRTNPSYVSQSGHVWQKADESFAPNAPVDPYYRNIAGAVDRNSGACSWSDRTIAFPDVSYIKGWCTPHDKHVVRTVTEVL